MNKHWMRWIALAWIIWGAGSQSLAPSVLRAQEEEPEVRYLPDGNGMIPIADPWDYPRISGLDVDDESRLLATYRPNFLGRDVEDKWDFSNLINTDRPDFTDATFTVGKGVTYIETGYTFRKSVDSLANTTITKRSLPETLLRYGLSDEFEVRVKWNGYVLSDVVDRNLGQTTQVFGGDDMILAFKYEMRQQEDWIPILTLLSGSTIPTGTNGVSSNALQPFVNLVGGWGLRRWLYLKWSVGVDWQKTSVSTLIGGGSEPSGPAVVVLRDNINLYHQSASFCYSSSHRAWVAS